MLIVNADAPCLADIQKLALDLKEGAERISGNGIFDWMKVLSFIRMMNAAMSLQDASHNICPKLGQCLKCISGVMVHRVAPHL